MTYVCLFHSGCLASHLLIKIFTQAYCNHLCWIYSRATVWLFCWWNPNIKVESTLCPKNKQFNSWAYISCPKMALVATICLTAKYSKNTMKLKNITKQQICRIQWIPQFIFSQIKIHSHWFQQKLIKILATIASLTYFIYWLIYLSETITHPIFCLCIWAAGFLLSSAEWLCEPVWKSVRGEQRGRWKIHVVLGCGFPSALVSLVSF